MTATVGLHIADGLTLPLEYVTKTAAVLAQRRKGKSYLAAVIAEEMYAAGVPWVILDPTGAHWGLRAGIDGNPAKGLNVVIFGGKHGDYPIGANDGALIADLVVDHPRWYIIDLSMFETGADEKKFATAFAKRLYRRKLNAAEGTVLHVFVDEAQRFVPQVLLDKTEGDAAMLGAFQSLVLKGGLHGIGTTLISQRAAAVNKNVLEQLDILFLLRIVGPNDQKAVRDYMKAEANKEQVEALMVSLASQPVGTGWVWEPGAEPPLFEQAAFRARRTFNSSATPKAGQTIIEPASLAPIDVEGLRASMAEAVERAEADDPVKLRRVIADLRKQLLADPEKLATRIAELEEALAESEARTVEPEIVEIDKPVLDEALIIRLEAALEPVAGVLCEVQDRLAWETTVTDDAVEMKRVLAARDRTPPAKAAPVRAPAAVKAEPVRAPARDHAQTVADGRPAEHGHEKLGKGEWKVLDALSQFPDGLDQNALAFVAGYSAKASTMRVMLAKLRRAGLVEPAGTPRLTSDGLRVAPPQPVLRGEDLLNHWRNHPRIGEGERRVLDALIAAFPDELSHEDLCAAAGYSPDASTMRVMLSKLRKLGLVGKQRRLADEFAWAIGVE